MASGDLPEFLATGEKARLIPVLADTNKENRATSVFLACLGAVSEYGQSMLGSVGKRIGKRAQIECFTEVRLREEGERRDRPDGLVLVRVGKSTWTALVEAKIANAQLDAEQVERYVALAKANKIDAVITISNQFAALPTHHPIKLSKSKLRGVELYHWSWMFILTQAILVLQTEDDIDADQKFILDETARYFSHDSSGVKTFDRMNSEWKDVATKVKSGANLAKNSDAVENTVGSWHQEQRDLCLILTRRLAATVSLRLSRAHRDDPERRLRDDCDFLAKEKRLQVTFNIPDAAASLDVVADLTRRTIACSMCLEAPKDRRSLKARANWLVRQLAKVDSPEVMIKAHFPGRAPATQADLSAVRADPSVLNGENARLVPNWLEVIMVRDIAGKFSGSKTFVEQIEALVPDFYEQVGENLRAWVPPPPKLQPPQIGTDAPATDGAEQPHD